MGQPRESDFAHPFETTGLGAWFPNAGTKNFDAVLEQLSGGGEYLFFGFGRTRAGYDDGAGAIHARKSERREIKFHI